MSSIRLISIWMFLTAGIAPMAMSQVTATWTGAGVDDLYSNPDNWDLGGSVPINGGTTYDVVIPNGALVVFDITGVSEIQSLDIGREWVL